MTELSLVLAVNLLLLFPIANAVSEFIHNGLGIGEGENPDRPIRLALRQFDKFPGLAPPPGCWNTYLLGPSSPNETNGSGTPKAKKNY